MVVDVYMRRYLKIYLYNILLNIKIMKQYKFDMFIGMCSNLLVQVSSIIFLWVIFDNIKSFAGWGYYEALLIYGVFTLCKGLNNIFFDNLWIVGKEFIRKGTFDILMIRPVGELFQIISQKIQFDGFGTLILGIVVTKAAFANLPITLSIGSILLWILIIIMGTIIIALINLILTVSSFWVIKSNNIIWMIYSISDFGQYPLNVFSTAINILLTAVIPYGFVSYYPVSYMLGKMNVNVIFIEAAVVVILLVLGLKLWNFGMKKYESSGN